MELFFPCIKCFQENQDQNFNFTYIDFQDNGKYEMKCNRGHEYITFVQNEQFEILFEMGALALLDGYSRESVSSFTSALERFHEYCIKVLLAKNNVPFEEFTSTWKMVNAASERQLGAFYFLYLNEFKEAPPKLHDNISPFRNRVIHRGYIPKKNEVMKYATTVYDYIINISKRLRAECNEFISEPYFQRMRELTKEVNKEYAFPQSIRTIIDFALADELFGVYTFEESLKQIKDEIGWQYSK